MPVIASTITTLCAFAPMLVWPGMIGDFMSYLPVTLIIALSASLLVALVFNPTLCAYFMTVRRKKDSQGESEFKKAYRSCLSWLLTPAPDEGTKGYFYRNWALPLVFVLFALLGAGISLMATLLETENPAVYGFATILVGVGTVAFGLQGVVWLVWSVVRVSTGATTSYGPYVTDRRSGVIWSMGAIFAFTFVAYGVFGQGVEFFPEIDPEQIFVDVEAPSGAPWRRRMSSCAGSSRTRKTRRTCCTPWRTSARKGSASKAVARWEEAGAASRTTAASPSI